VIVTLQAFVMTFGALIASAGLVLLFLRNEQAQNKIKLLGQEFEISTPALVVFLAGCTVFVIPLVVPIKNPDRPIVIIGQQTREHLPPRPAPGDKGPQPPSPGLILFHASNNPQALNPVLDWQRGESYANTYDLTLYPGALALIAGPGTDQWQGRNSAPLILYPFEGNFETEVKVVLSPTEKYQMAGLGVRSAADKNTYLRITRLMDNPGQGILMQSSIQSTGFRGSFSPYLDDIVYFKIERRGSLFNFHYSSSGRYWVNLQKDYVFNMPTEVEIFLVVYSTTSSRGIVAQFSDFQIVRK
jgi:hypothetical protein